MSKRILSIILTVALLCGCVAVTGMTAVADTSQQKIVVVGDSITAGIHFTNNSYATGVFENNYPALLEQKLNAAGTAVNYTVVNAGLSGAAAVGNSEAGTSDSAFSWLSTAQSRGLVQSADAVVIMLGTNDAANNWSARKALFKAEYKKIVNAFVAKNPDVDIYIATSTYNESNSKKALSSEVVLMQLELAAELGASVIDAHTATRQYAKENGISALIDAKDIELGVNLHISEAGHEVVAAKAAAVISGTADAYSTYSIQGAGGWNTTSKDADLIPSTDFNKLNGVTQEGVTASVANVTDGRLSSVTGTTDGYNYGTMNADPIIFDLGKTMNIQRIVFGDFSWGTTFSRYVKNIRVSNSKSDVTSAPAVISETASDGSAARVFTLTKATQGRYIAFSLTNPWGTELGELSVVGVETPLAQLPATVEAVTTLPTETNLLASATTDAADPTKLTDGVLCTDEDTRWIKELGTSPCLTWDLGEICIIDQVFVGSEFGSAQYIRDVKIYVGNNKDTLYSKANLALFSTAIGTSKNNLLYKTGMSYTGQYVGFQFAITPGEPDWNLLRLGELGVYGTKLTAPITALGAQIRGEVQAEGSTAIRFGFDMAATGVSHANSDPASSGDYTRSIAADAAVVINGTSYTVIDFGTIVSSNSGDTALTMADVDDKKTKVVSAARLYDDVDDTTTFTAVVTNVPATQWDTVIQARGYVTVTDGENTYTFYGAQLGKSVNDVKTVAG